VIGTIWLLFVLPNARQIFEDPLLFCSSGQYCTSESADVAITLQICNHEVRDLNQGWATSSTDGGSSRFSFFSQMVWYLEIDHEPLLQVYIFMVIFVE
jgi:hypothetical protein